MNKPAVRIAVETVDSEGATILNSMRRWYSQICVEKRVSSLCDWFRSKDSR